MKTFNEWQNENINPISESNTIDDLIQKLKFAGVDIVDLIRYDIEPKNLHKDVMDARNHYDEAIEILKKISLKKDDQGVYLGSKEYNIDQ